MVSKMSTKQLALEIDEILSNTQLGGKPRTNKNKSKKTEMLKSKKSKKKLSRSALDTKDDELNKYVSSLVNLRRSTRPKSIKSAKASKSKKSKKSKKTRGSKKLKRGLPEKLILFRKLTEASSDVIDKKGPLAMKVAKAVKDDLTKKMDAATIESDYAGFIKKAIQHLKDNSDHYIKLAKTLS